MFNCRRNSLRSIHAASKTNHLSSISYNQTIEPHLFTKNALHEFFAKAARQNVFIFDVRIHFSCECRLTNMGTHYSRRTKVNQFLINAAIGFVPLLCRQAVDTAHQVLVTIVDTITRKMLNGSNHFMLGAGFHVSLCHLDDTIRIASVGTNIRNGVFRVHINIYDRLKGPVDAAGTALTACNRREFICRLRIICCRASHWAGHVGTISQTAVASGAATFKVTCNQKWNFSFCLKTFGKFMHFLARKRTVHNTARLNEVKKRFWF